VTGASALASASPPGALELLPGGPNPFRRATTVRFRLGSPQRVTADVLDVAGRRVDLLLDGRALGAGPHELRWPAGRTAPAAGVYWVRLRAGDGTERTARLVRIDGAGSAPR